MCDCEYEGSGETQSHLNLGYPPMSKLIQIIIGAEAASLLTYDNLAHCLKDMAKRCRPRSDTDCSILIGGESQTLRGIAFNPTYS